MFLITMSLLRSGLSNVAFWCTKNQQHLNIQIAGISLSANPSPSSYCTGGTQLINAKEICALGEIFICMYNAINKIKFFTRFHFNVLFSLLDKVVMQSRVSKVLHGLSHAYFPALFVCVVVR